MLLYWKIKVKRRFPLDQIKGRKGIKKELLLRLGFPKTKKRRKKFQSRALSKLIFILCFLNLLSYKYKEIKEDFERI